MGAYVFTTPETIWLTLFCSLLFAISFSSYVYIYYHRNYPPLKAKHVPIMGLFLLNFPDALHKSDQNTDQWSSLQHSNGVFGYKGLWSVCSLWEVWVQFCFGASLTLALLIFRLYTVRHVFLLQQSLSKRPIVVPWLIFCIPMGVIGITSSAIPRFAVKIDDSTGCSVTLTFKCLFFSMAGICALIVIYFTWQLRNVRSAFNEFRELCFGSFALIFCVVWNSAIILNQYHWSAWGVYSMILLNVFTSTFFFGLVFFRPFYGHIFRREECMQNFLNNLTRDTDESLEMTASLAAAAAISNNAKNNGGGRVRPLRTDATGQHYGSPV
ncbi:hypothetical protein BDF19DRAFT_421770 [Syncephalis fuscata]|nr:hypothetical protein BDF19DRAFT_421770 [Syncephalis fuscata]